MKLERLYEHSLPTGVLGLAATADGATLYAACMDGGIYEITTANGERRVFEGRHQSFASGCVLLPDRPVLISAGYDGVLLWHDLRTRQTFRRVQAHTFWSWQLALSSQGHRVASVTGQYLPGGWKYEPAPSPEPTVKVYDAVTGELCRAYQMEPPVQSVAFSPDGRYLAAANMMGQVSVFDLEAPPDAPPAAAWKTDAFTSWGDIKSHHYSGGIFGLAFNPDGSRLLACGMGPMTDPMAGNGKMTWQRWDWRATPPTMQDQIRDGEHGSGLMEALAWHPQGHCFVMAGRQAQGTWNMAVFAAEDGKLLHSLDTKKRITQARFTADGCCLFLAGAIGQPSRNEKGEWPDYGRVQAWRMVDT